VVLQAPRQQDGDRIVGPDAECVQRIGRLMDAGQQLGIGPADRLVLGFARAQEGRAVLSPKAAPALRKIS
jgi:hypothetical protein